MMLGSGRRATCLLVVACCVAVAAAQTFQYSRGWTNGRKRTAGANLAAHQQLHARRAAEVAVKRAAAILEDAGLLLVPAACDAQPITFHLLRRPPTMQQQQQQEEVEEAATRGQESLVAPPPPQTAAAEPEMASGGGEHAATFAF